MLQLSFFAFQLWTWLWNTLWVDVHGGDNHHDRVLRQGQTWGLDMCEGSRGQVHDDVEAEIRSLA